MSFMLFLSLLLFLFKSVNCVFIFCVCSKGNSSTAMLRDARMFAYLLTKKWAMEGDCSESLLVLYSRYDGIVSIVVMFHIHVLYTIQNKLRTNCSQTCQRQSFELNDLKF